jgi:hypothetical protein
MRSSVVVAIRKPLGADSREEHPREVLMACELYRLRCCFLGFPFYTKGKTGKNLPFPRGKATVTQRRPCGVTKTISCGSQRFKYCCGGCVGSLVIFPSNGHHRNDWGICEFTSCVGRSVLETVLRPYHRGVTHRMKTTYVCLSRGSFANSRPVYSKSSDLGSAHISSPTVKQLLITSMSN